MNVPRWFMLLGVPLVQSGCAEAATIQSENAYSGRVVFGTDTQTVVIRVKVDTVLSRVKLLEGPSVTVLPSRAEKDDGFVKASECKVYSSLHWECTESAVFYGVGGRLARGDEWNADGMFLSHRHRVFSGKWEQTWQSFIRVVEPDRSVLSRLRSSVSKSPRE